MAGERPDAIPGAAVSAAMRAFITGRSGLTVSRGAMRDALVVAAPFLRAAHAEAGTRHVHDKMCRPPCTCDCLACRDGNCSLAHPEVGSEEGEHKSVGAAACDVHAKRVGRDLTSNEVMAVMTGVQTAFSRFAPAARCFAPHPADRPPENRSGAHLPFGGDGQDVPGERADAIPAKRWKALVCPICWDGPNLGPVSGRAWSCSNGHPFVDAVEVEVVPVDP